MAVVRRARERLLLPALLILLSIGGLVAIVRREMVVGRVRVAREDEALRRLRDLAAAEAAFHERRGRYGWVEDLEREGVLGALAVVEEEGVRRVACPGYRLDVLLPHGLTPGDLVRLAPREAGYQNPDLERRHFALVARPWGPEPRGYRTWYVDETGQVYLSEGVSDVESRTRNPLPDLHLSSSGLPEVVGLRWYRLDDQDEP
jgi:hypothetical protein